ncbi:MAG TPA: DUF4914 family protein [Kiritimatiellia bacterium]|mgnify:CR=1 FL=1|nr:DUF4914 family protein [Kiritimatiellia bacterium]HMO98302.1 DUF4914 family protein [Kiritimatiellia bacterium]HMP95502.1 DUF4914 family protein [Kiritimatiellia bacterium]
MKLDQIDFEIPNDLKEVLKVCPGYIVAHNKTDLFNLAIRDAVNGVHEVAYDVPGKGRVVEVNVCQVKNGISANYTESYMRRRDPDCMVIADDLPTDKPRYKDLYGKEFSELRQETFEWLKTQELALFPFFAGAPGKGTHALVVGPSNAGFFALGLALLQGILDSDQVPENFDPKAVIYVAPVFRHTHFDGKQMVVHNRREKRHELFSYNLYPGPSAKKGIYGVLLSLGEREKWVTAHCSTVQVITPYANKITIMHEGASGGGKSEMLEQVHREKDGSLLLGVNIQTGERRTIVMPRNCDLRPVTDDMALCHPSLARRDGRLALMDAEQGWFVRVNHITRYGVDPHLEEMTIHPTEPLLFLNIDAHPGSTALIWEHIQDEPGKPCPNPRVIVPRKAVPGIVSGAVSVDVRSFGVRTPPCSKELPTYGILGLFHLLPPALAWLWRLVAPRGHANPSIVQTEGMSSEGVGSYWPFATGRMVDHANLLLQQIVDTPKVRYILCPNQHVGVWKTSFMPQWIAREYLARRGGAKFSEEQVVPARCPLLGYALNGITIEGQTIPSIMLRVETQKEVGPDAYDLGAVKLGEFFHQELEQYRVKDLDPLGHKIIDACLRGASVAEYEQLIPHPLIEREEELIDG